MDFSIFLFVFFVQLCERVSQLLNQRDIEMSHIKSVLVEWENTFGNEKQHQHIKMVNNKNNLIQYYKSNKLYQVEMDFQL
jgi:hypothetical protein